MGTWNFSYDAVDRLMSATQTVASANAQYTNTPIGWAYDSFGNRTQAGGPVIKIFLNHRKLCPVHRGLIAMSGSSHHAAGGITMAPCPLA
jgi:hypothetical protein